MLSEAETPGASVEDVFAFPLSFAQQRLWFIDQLEPHSSAYNILSAVRLTGRLDVAALEQTLGEVLRRHEVLRTYFAVIEGQPMQVVVPAQSFELPLVNLSEVEGRGQEAQVGTLVKAEVQEPFNLSTGPLWRAKLLRLSEGEHVVLLTMHHIISDAWSITVLMQEVAALYQAFTRGQPSPLPELAIQYADFALWQREWLTGKVLEDQLQYWRERLAGSPALLELPTDRPRPPTQSYRGAHEAFALSKESSEAIKAFSRREGATLFMSLLAAFQVLLARYNGQEDIVVGTPIAGRNRAEIEPLIGFFVNTLVLRTDLSGEPSFRELVRRVREVCLGAYAHQDLPFEKLVEELQPERSLSHAPLVQVIFAVQNAPEGSFHLPDLQLSAIEETNDTAKFDLVLHMQESPGAITGTLGYSTDLFEQATVRRMIEHFTTLLEAATARPEERMWGLPLLDGEERDRLLSAWNNTGSDYRREACVHHLFESQVERSPKAIAVADEAEELTYGELNRRANQLAHRLRAQGVGPEATVGILTERSVEMLVGLLGVLKAGAACVPLDPEYPRKRLDFMVSDSGLQVLVTQSRLKDKLHAAGLTVVCLDDDWPEIEQSPADNPSAEVTAENLAYVIYTSGSTGRAKAVSLLHRGLCNRLVSGQNIYRLTEADRVLHKASFSFDASLWEIFWPLTVGARLVLARPGGQRDSGYLAQLIARQHISVAHFVPSMLDVFLQEPEVRQCLDLKRVYCGGEVLPVEFPRRFFALLPGADLYNQYGPTETSVNVTYWKCQRDAEPRSIPLGRPFANTQLYILDKYQQPVPVGVGGELYIGGDGLSRGYFGRPELTAERFIPHPFSDTPGARLYRTGDLCRYLPDGAVEFLGRVDHQVKVRGFRVELGEIEAALAQHPEVREAVALAQEERPGALRINAYVIAPRGATATGGELRDYLKEHVPDYMVPSAVMVLAEFPLTPNGKVDRRALLTVNQEQPDSGLNHVAPRTPIEQVLVSLWEEVLGATQVGIGDDFFDLGGHSLLATQLISRVRVAFQVEIALRELFESPTVETLAATVEEALRAQQGIRVPPIVPVPREKPLPLSFAQQRLWFLTQLEPDSPFYNVPAAVRLTGRLDLAALEQTFSEVIRRHEVLRTRFVVVDNQPVQIVDPPAPLRAPIVDLSSMPEEEREAEIRKLVDEESAQLFDLAEGPLVRLKLLRLSDDEQVCLLSLHHIISDGWSTGILTREIATLYRSFSQQQPSPLPELEIQYADYAHWQREWLQGEALEQQLDYWREQLAGAPPVLELPIDRPRPAAQSYRGSRESFRLTKELTESLKELSRREGVTLYMTLLAAFQILLARHSGQDDIVVGTPIAGRARIETEPLIGFFVNTLVLRTKLSPEQSFTQVVRQVREVCLGAYAHQDLPFEMLVEQLQPQRSLSYSPLFQVLFVLQNTPSEDLLLPGLQMELVQGEDRIAQFDLTLGMVEEDQCLRGALEYNSDIFDAASVARLASHLLLLLRSIADHPLRPVSRLPLLPPHERHLLLARWNNTPAAFPHDLCLHHLFARQAALTPHAPAILARGLRLSYARLDERANRLARHLLARGAAPDTPVALCLERGPDQLVALLGVLKAGAPYLPLDPRYPARRLAATCADAGARLLVTTRPLLSAPLRAVAEAVVLLDEEAAGIAARAATDPGARVAAGNLAYVIYTSGSTGVPKGVGVAHRAVVSHNHAVRDLYGLGAADRVLQFASPSFDVAVEEIFPTWLSGGAVVLREEEALGSARGFFGHLAAEGVTVVNVPTAFWQQMVAGAEAEPEVLAGVRLRVAAVGGEMGQAAGFAQARRVLGGRVRLLNVYGPTETTVTNTAFEYGAGDGGGAHQPAEEPRGGVPIGRPIANTEVYVLDASMQPVPVGVWGELYIGGDGLARGYLRRPALTAERFVPHPFGGAGGARLYRTGDVVRYTGAGELEFVGRRDGQVKVRGYRVELGEVEAALGGHAAVRECAVAVREEAGGDRRLVAYVVVEAGREPAGRGGGARGRGVAAIPEGAAAGAHGAERVRGGGGAAADAERESGSARAARAGGGGGGGGREYLAPRTVTEELVCGMWEEVLGVGRVGVGDDFFELGGHSLLATQVISRVRQAFGVEVALRSLFSSPTVAELSAAIEEMLMEKIERMSDEEAEQWLNKAF